MLVLLKRVVCSVASTSSYFNTIDRAAAEQAWEQEKLRITADEEYSAKNLIQKDVIG